MQRIIQINIAGRILPIEEDAYLSLRDYINSLHHQFGGDDGREIIEDIENRIAELFAIRLQGGVAAIDRADVKKVIDTLGAASDLHDGSSTRGSHKSGSTTTGHGGHKQAGSSQNIGRGRLLRNPFDKVVGGVCSGIAQYFDVDVVIIRLVMALFLTMGIGFVAYIIAWAIIPAAKSREELYNMTNGQPMTFHELTNTVGVELEDLKKRGEQMSRELQDYFKKKK
jgi:phage shock protein PspC (stress-responsive transcriptional regulator)